MFKIGDFALYSPRGICKIKDIVTQGNNNEKFYVLQPVNSTHAFTIYVPANNSEAKLKWLVSVEEINALIADATKSKITWIDDDKKRQLAFRKILISGDRLQLLSLIRLLYQKQQEMRKQNKKLHITDEKAFKDAEMLVYDEFAFVLNIKRESVIEFIASNIEQLK